MPNESSDDLEVVLEPWEFFTQDHAIKEWLQKIPKLEIWAMEKIENFTGLKGYQKIIQNSLYRATDKHVMAS